MRVLVLGDVGVVDGMIHIGDEAMFEELARQATRRSLGVVALSSNPSDTSARYGVDSIAQVGFAFTGADARDRMRARSDAVIALARGSGSHGDRGDSIPGEDPARAVIDAVRDADAVIVSGGGNIASNWPLHIWERATLARLAEIFGVPFALSGQTVGPRLDPEDLPTVVRMLESARLIGVREGASAELVRSLGVPPDRVTLSVDDASFLGDAVATSEPYCLVSLSLHVGNVPRDAFISAVARALDVLSEETSLDIVFLPHFASTDPAVVAGDAVLHRSVREAMRTPSRALVATTAREAADAARRAALVVTSRYHPAVFAVAAGVPTLAISVDPYTRIKLTGALENFGQGGVVDLETDAVDTIADRARLVWADRALTSAAHPERAEQARRDSDRWWSRLLAPPS